MKFTDQKNRAFGYLFLRILAGVIFMMQGYGKVFEIGLENTFAFFEPYETTWLPHWLLEFTNFFTGYGELIFGFFLIIGLFRYFSAAMLGVILIVVSYGHGLMEPIWTLDHVIFRAILLAPLFFLPNEWDVFHLDRFIIMRRKR